MTIHQAAYLCRRLSMTALPELSCTLPRVSPELVSKGEGYDVIGELVGNPQVAAQVPHHHVHVPKRPVR
eukprot:7353-Eustigmatos_ZCMA.PRE.1